MQRVCVMCLCKTTLTVARVRCGARRPRGRRVHHQPHARGDERQQAEPGDRRSPVQPSGWVRVQQRSVLPIMPCSDTHCVTRVCVCVCSDDGGGGRERPAAGLQSRGEGRRQAHAADHTGHPADEQRDEGHQTHSCQTLHRRRRDGGLHTTVRLTKHLTFTKTTNET